MHLIEYVFPLAFDLDSGILSEFCDLLDHSRIVDCHLRRIDNHHHVEESLNDGLGDVENVDLIICHIGADLGDDADCVLADNGDDCSVHLKFKFR